ncbi:hypothetical protein APTSU1_001575100 [Apodemus speciosus]|uniref:Uncharacterized protein n=1 Tax=Apodemus speciosus TaxID=105296 RepID=A0ABQ0FMN6_APOSI
MNVGSSITRNYATVDSQDKPSVNKQAFDREAFQTKELTPRDEVWINRKTQTTTETAATQRLLLG